MNATKGIRGSISSIMTRIGGVFKTIGGGIGKSVAFITGAFADAGKAFSDIGKQFGLVSKTAKTTADGAKTAGSVLSRLGSFFKTVFTAFQGVGRVLGRLFLPLTILLTAVDSIKGSIDGFTKQEGGFFRKLFAGVIGGLKGAVVGLIGIPLDLLKSAVGFIAGKLGFDGFQETLASFSIAGLIGSMFDKIKNTVLGFFDAMKDETGSFNFGRIIKVLVGTIFNTLTAPIRLLLEGLAKLAENIPLKGDDIAAGIRSFKGKLTMDTGVDEAIQNVENKTAASEQSENLNKASTELKSEERSAGVTIPDVINAVSSTNNSTRMGDNYVITTPPAADSISTGLTNR